MAGKPLRVLLIEDSEDDALLLTRELRRQGYDAQVRRVARQQEMIAALDEGPWDVVLSDYYLPSFDIATALELLRQRHLDVPFIIVSASVGERKAVDAMRHGAHDYVMKDALGRLGPAIEREMSDADNRRERRRAEHYIGELNRDLQLRLSELQTLLDIVPIGIAIAADADADRIRINRRLADLLGVPADVNASPNDRNVDRPPLRYLVNGRELRPEELPVHRAAREGRAVDHFELEAVRPDGTSAHLLGSAVPLHDGQKNVRGAVGAFMDITERRATEAALRNSEKLATVGRLAATIAHEINNPLEAVTNVLYLLGRTPDLPPAAAQYVTIAQQELTRIASIVKQTLGFYRDTTTPILIQLTEVLDGVLGLYDRRIRGQGIRVERRYETEGDVFAFPGEIRQVFSNLIVNAIEALPLRGRLWLHVYEAADPHDPERHGVRIVIADNGPGIAEEARARLFEPFFTTKGEKGTGLGLWVSQGIIRKHDGNIRMRSSTRPGASGTVFSIFLPSDTKTKGEAVRKPPRRTRAS
jgi:signal transduction histidine kinase/ActR/RegA family two-component response regulator